MYFCGDDVCVSDCDAQAECGLYAPVVNTTCPLNVCCSQFGFCGTTEEFCGTGCQSGCEPVNEPSCSGASSKQVYGGYYEAWNYQHPCDVLTPSNIDVVPWTHLFYSFAGINTGNSEIETTYAHDESYMQDIVALKNKKDNLKVFISVGGWDLGGEPFSDMVRFPGTRKAFINSATSFMEKYGFDGIDIDWEYPAASDRGGRDEDSGNFVTFLKELKNACGDDYQITATLPSSYWYLKGFDIKGMSDHVNYFNFMSYDIHGTWDGNSEYTSSVVNPHTNLTEISSGLDLLWRNNIDPSKVLLGLGFYGRSFTLKDSSCTTPGCSFDTSAYEGGGATPGQCTGTSGILSDYEISRVITKYNPDVVYNEEAAVNWMTWNENQWVSFDNAKTLKQKADFANSKCLGGLFGWALDEGGPGSRANPNDLDPLDSSMEGANIDGGSDGTGDFYADQSVLDPVSNTVHAIAPVNIIVAPTTLPTHTTFHIGDFITPLEVAWAVMVTKTSSGVPTVTSSITRTITTTTFTIPAYTGNVIPWWNWNLTKSNITESKTTLFPSINLDPIYFTDQPITQTQTGGNGSFVFGTGTRTIYPPPWPWWTNSISAEIPTPTVHFIEGPPSPTCTSGCGTKCTSYCIGPCMDKCDDPKAISGWIDPMDPDPPSHIDCIGPDCFNGECIGPYCVIRGCEGDDCDETSHSCLGPHCVETSCRGPGCKNGICIETDDCQEVGCYGTHCGSKGRCLGPNCISLGCIGPPGSCTTASGECTSSECSKVSCTGPHCQNGICSGEGCKSEDSDCESSEADTCTEYISSSLVTPESTYTTSTSTSCQTITACGAEPSTTTTTLSDDPSSGTVFKYYHWSFDSAVASSVAKEIDAEFSSLPCHNYYLHYDVEFIKDDIHKSVNNK
ncbi:hypothetical protein N7450_001757 [Penicillium hetheringtonii]|uniref:chitinase n=1 Tax=Penicillium hetheringtonii TaxID=911720 RepID=A0AAD6H3T5_9EURO|nr:hypothetical protein N7450_001757 [Penicillium hetheringtonii]